MSEQEIKEHCRKVIEDFGAINGDMSRLDAWVNETLAPGVIQHSAGLGDLNYEQTKQMYASLVNAFNLNRSSLKHLIVEGDTVIWHFNWSGTHQGTFMGVPATGKKVDVGVVLITKMEGKKCQEVWAFQDNLGLMKQIGAIPAPPAK